MNNKKQIFEEYSIPKALMVMAMPAIASQIITLIYNIADTYFVGMTNNPNMVAACSLVLPISLIAIVISNLFGIGGGSLISRLLGAHRENEARKVFSISIWMSAATASFFILLTMSFSEQMLLLLGASNNTIEYARQYLVYVVGIGSFFNILAMVLSNLLRSAGYSREAAFGVGMGGILNIILDPLFMFVIFPDGMQVKGAAVATMLSNIVSFSYYIVKCIGIRETNIISIDFKQGLPEKESFVSLFNVGIPAGVSVLLFDLANMIANKRMSFYGDTALAAYGIVTKVERLPLNVGLGICLGMVPLIAYNYTSKNRKRMDGFFNCARAAGVGFAIICAVLYYVFSANIIEFFIREPETVRLGTHFLKARCLATPFMFLCFNMVHFFNAVGRGKTSFLLAVIRQAVFNIPIMIILDSIYGADGLVWTQMTADICTAVSSYVIYWAYRRKQKYELLRI